MNKGISSISYDQFGNLFKVTFGNKSSIEYVYSADGIKLKARHITAIPQGGTVSSSSMSWLLKVTSNRQQKITLQERRLGVFLIKKISHPYLTIKR